MKYQFPLGLLIGATLMAVASSYIIKPGHTRALQREYNKGVVFGIDQTANGYFRLAEYFPQIPADKHAQAIIEVGTGFKNLAIRWEQEHRPQ